MSFKCKLTKIESTHNNLRTNKVEGTALELPKVNTNFYMIADPIDKTKDYRKISTSLIKSVVKEDDDKYLFTTQNSTYKLKILWN